MTVCHKKSNDTDNYETQEWNATAEDNPHAGPTQRRQYPEPARYRKGDTTPPDGQTIYHVRPQNRTTCSRTDYGRRAAVHALLAYRSKARYPLDVVQHIERLNGRQRIDVEPPYLVAYLDEHGVFQLEHAELYARKMFLGA